MTKEEWAGLVCSYDTYGDKAQISSIPPNTPIRMRRPASSYFPEAVCYYGSLGLPTVRYNMPTDGYAPLLNEYYKYEAGLISPHEYLMRYRGHKQCIRRADVSQRDLERIASVSPRPISELLKADSGESCRKAAEAARTVQYKEAGCWPATPVFAQREQADKDKVNIIVRKYNIKFNFKN